MDKLREILGTVRRRRLALFLVFALVLGISPKVMIFAAQSDGGQNDTSIAARQVADTPTPTPTEDPTARAFLNAVISLLSSPGPKFGGSEAEIYDFDNELSSIRSNYHQDNEYDLETLPIIGNARTLESTNTNSYINAYLSILKLKRLAKEAKDAITTASSSHPTNDTQYNTFKLNFEAARDKLKEYTDEFEYQEGMALLKYCLSSDPGDVTQGDVIKYSRITNYSGYKNDLEKEYRIEEEYRTVTQGMYKLPSGTYVFNQTSIDLMEQLISILKEYGIDTTGTALITAFYNGSQISALLTDYQKVSNIIKPIEAMNGAPTTEKELENLVRIKSQYDALLKEDSKYGDMIPRDVKEKITTYSAAVTELNKIVNSIKNVTYPKTDAEYKTFKLAYETAMAEYEGIKLRYNMTSDVSGLIEGLSELLGDKTIVYDFLKRVHTIINTEDSQICNHYTEMEKIVKDYKALSTLNQSRIYNYVTFYTMYENATAAYKLRTRVDKLLLTLTADEKDKQEVAAIRKDYSALNNKAKAYFGKLYEGYIEELEYDDYAKSLELAARVDELIAKIGTVNTNSGQKIADAEAAYKALTDFQKALVKTYATLVSARKAYDLIANDISKAVVRGVASGYVYTRGLICPTPRVIIDNQQLVSGKDYTVSYSSNKKVGTGRVIITAVPGSGYTGTYTKSFKIVKDSISDGGVSGVAKQYKYTGKRIKPVPTLKVNGFILTRGKDYTFSYKNNKKRGTATIIIKGKGNYKGTKKKKFKIR